MPYTFDITTFCMSFLFCVAIGCLLFTSHTILLLLASSIIIILSAQPYEMCHHPTAFTEIAWAYKNENLNLGKIIPKTRQLSISATKISLRYSVPQYYILVCLSTCKKEERKVKRRSYYVCKSPVQKQVSKVLLIRAVARSENPGGT